VSKGAAQKIGVERFSLKNLTEEEVKEQYQVTKQVCRSCKLKRIMGTSIGHEILLERTSKFQPKRVSVTADWNIINRGLKMNVQDCFIEGSRLNYSGCNTQVK
jgi:hypothetical protein